MTLGTMFAKNNILEEYINKNPFWDPYEGTPQYSELNKVKVPTPSQIRAYQINKVKEFEKIAIKKRFTNLDPVTKQNFQMITNQFESEENQKINKMLENFVTKMNSFYYMNKDEEKTEQQWKDITKRLDNLNKSLKSLVKELNISTKNAQEQPTVLGQTLELIQENLSACRIGSLDAEKINLFLKNINQLKGDTLEELGVAYFKNLKVPNIDSIRLGSVYLNTDGREGRHRGQLIQDLIFYDLNSPDILNDIEVEYKPVGSNQTIKASLSKMFKDIEEANKGSKQIVINDKTYDVLMNLNQISIQAKSGKNQLPWNKNASTSVSIGEYGIDNLELSIKRTFELLQSLNSKENKNQPWLVKDISKDYDALANYGLATVLNKVLHLSEKGNQYLLTPYGFMSYSARLEQLMKTENYIALLQDNIILNNSTLSTKHKVGMTQK